MDQRVRFPLNRAVSILVDFVEYDNPQRRFAFVLERKVIDNRGYHELRVRIPKAFVTRVKDHEGRRKLFQLIEQKIYKVFYNIGKTRVVVMDDGALKFKGPLKTHTNEVHLKETTFSTMLLLIDNNFNRNDEMVDENINVTFRKEAEETSDNDGQIEGDSKDKSDIEMSNSADATPSEDKITIEDVKVHEVITLN